MVELLQSILRGEGKRSNIGRTYNYDAILILNEANQKHNNRSPGGLGELG